MTKYTKETRYLLERIIAIMLSFALVFTLLQTTAFAADDSDSDTESSDSIESVSTIST